MTCPPAKKTKRTISCEELRPVIHVPRAMLQEIGIKLRSEALPVGSHSGSGGFRGSDNICVYIYIQDLIPYRQ